MTTPQIIVYGLDSIGYRIFCLLRQQKAAVIGVNRYPIPGETEIVVGDLLSAETLRKARIESAQTLVIANHDDATNLEILLQARLLNPRIRIVNRLYNHSLGDRLDRTLPLHFTMSVAELSAPIFAFAAIGQAAIGHLRLFQGIWPIYEEHIHIGHQRLSLIERLRKSLLWLAQFQRHLRSGLLVTLLLLFTIFLATAAYVCFGWGQRNFADALYFSVGMITGAGGNEDIAERASTIMKVFTAVMMLVGAGVIGIFYALLNDLVLGSRLRSFWDVTRVPQKNHYIICGMGGTGLKVAQQLVSQGHKVVVIERDDNNRFLSAARSQQISVIIADASLPLTLHSANISQATALLAVTDDDMGNLEISLTAKELAPQLSIIVRNNNPALTERMDQVFDFNAVLNPFDIAAPAFAAAALGGRILGSGVTGEILWIALSLLITPAYPFCHQSVQDIAIEADLVPLYLQTAQQQLHGWDLLKTILQPGDVLHLTIPAKNIERLWRKSKVKAENL
jgi:Trk K+ transport system NAD-binding subunit